MVHKSVASQGFDTPLRFCPGGQPQSTAKPLPSVTRWRCDNLPFEVVTTPKRNETRKKIEVCSARARYRLPYREPSGSTFLVHAIV
ncbi:MAG: Unknown protein [uncultured Thiotrichaceae bacterium]|uniref:Uncharacterized protein n=1 Tax=uncultured Thiotrichaceae bacterium TaxID=298394 RepID=A0A6S6SGP1_9GAMM|nr:MAG: Unknown protein [uncultured Thiotrichaceae bacterium]